MTADTQPPTVTITLTEDEVPAESSSLMSEPRRAFWASFWSGSSLQQSKLMVFQHAMNTTPRPTNPSQSIGYAFQKQEKLHDREPALLVAEMEALDPHFFDEYPRQDMSQPMSMSAKCAAVGVAARHFYRHGIAGRSALPGLPGDPAEERWDMTFAE